MRAHDYQKAALRTISKNNIISGNQPDLVHCVLGLSSETGELIKDKYDEENIMQEVGDICWYIAIGLHALKIDMEDLVTFGETDDPFEDIVVHVGAAADVIKRHIFYKVELDEPAFIEALSNVILCLSEICSEMEYTLEDAMDMNIRKLAIRYPEKFTTEYAVDRDVRKENRVFEK